MTYELALSLKNKGFPQELKDVVSENIYFDSNKEIVIGAFVESEVSEKMVKVPTLSELIEACGEGFKNLSKMGDKNWGANNIMEQQLNGSYKLNEPKGYGSTPEESVARLWLALQG